MTADRQILDQWAKRCARSADRAVANAPLLTRSADTVQAAVDILRHAVEIRNRPTMSHKTFREIPKSSAYLAHTNALEKEADWLEKSVMDHLNKVNL